MANFETLAAKSGNQSEVALETMERKTEAALGMIDEKLKRVMGDWLGSDRLTALIAEVCQ